MDFHGSSFFRLFLLSTLLCSLSTADSSGSVFFIDGGDKIHQYLRSPSVDGVVQSQSMSIPEVGAAVSVLLGFAPPATLSASGSSKLNEILKPNPFDRPRAVFMLEVSGVEVTPASAMFSNALRRKIDLGSDKAHIQLPDAEISVVSLDERLVDYTDKEISDFATWFGGSYVADALVLLNGELTIPLASGVTINLHMSEKADRKFIASLLALFRNSRKAVEMHEDLLHGTLRPAELVMGYFDGIKALQEQYGSEDIVQHGVELLLAMLSKTFDSLQAAFKGQIVGVILFNGTPAPESEVMMTVKLNSCSSARWLAEANTSPNATNATTAEVVLVRRTLAWITGIILLVSTFLGIYLLLNMPLTRDTLLYSNVKLD